MLKALLKKQFLESTAFVYQSGKEGKNRSIGVIVAYVFLLLYAVVVIGAMFFLVAQTLCGSLIMLDLEWLYFALMSLFATVLGIVGSAFMAYSGLYEARDNELLLSMPIPPAKLLFVRILWLYITCLLFELLVLVPTGIVYIMNGGRTVMWVIAYVIMAFLLPLFALSLSCILGLVIAFFATRIRNKSLITVVLTLAFLGLYFYGYSQVGNLLNLLLKNAQAVADTVKGVLYPVYLLGMASIGDFVALIAVAGIVIGCFAIMYLVLSKSFVSLLTKKRGAVKKAYIRKDMKPGTVSGALFRKEVKRFLGCPVYLLNGGLGVVFLAVALVALLVKWNWLKETLGQMLPGMEGMLSPIVCLAICLLTSMDCVSAPSISLEGKNIWVLQSLPVRSSDVFKAKLKLHLVVNVVPAIICFLTACVFLQQGIVLSLLEAFFIVGFVLLCGLSGLVLNLLSPNLTWTNESIPVKQGASVVISMFGSWGVLIGIAILYILLGSFVGTVWFLIFGLIIIWAVNGGLWNFLCTKGNRIWNNL